MFSILPLRQIFKVPCEMMKFLVESGGNCKDKSDLFQEEDAASLWREVKMCIGSWLCTVPRLHGT